MAVKTAVSVIIGAELGGSFKGAFGSAQKQLGTLGNAIKGLNKSSENINAFKALGRDTLTARRGWQSAEAEALRLAKAIRAAEKPSKELNASFRNAKKEAALAKSAYQQNRTALSEMSATLKTAGIDTRNLTAEQTRLGKALDTLRARQSALSAIEAKKQANLSNRAAYRSQIVDMVALGGTLYGMIKPAIAFESAMADVKKVVDFKSPEELRQKEADIKGLSKTIPLSLEGLATNVGSTLLPTINSLVGIFGKVAGTLAEFAEKHPTLIKYIGLAVAGMASMRLATFALGYGFTFLKGGVLTVMSVFTQARTVFSLLRLGVGGLIPVIKAVGMAFISNPIGLVIAGIAAGAFLVIKYWKPISAFFKNLFAPVVAVFKEVWSWISGLWDKAKEIFSGIKEWVKDSWVGKAWNWAFGGDEDKAEENKPPKIGESVSETYTPAGQSPVELPRSNVSTNTSQSSVSVNAPITINASPGMNAEEVAKQVSKELDAREQAAARRQRGANYD